MVKIKQPAGVNYLIQTHHYTRQYAEEYIDMLISQSKSYIEQKKRGKKVAPQITIEQLQTQLENIEKFEIEEVKT